MIKQYTLKGTGKNYYRVQVSYTPKGGKRHQRTFYKGSKGERISSKKEALSYEQEFKYKLIKEVDNKLSQLNFREYLEKFLERARLQFLPSTVYQYNGDLKKWLPVEFMEKLVSKINKNDAFNFIHQEMIEKGATPHTQKRVLKSVRRVMESALEDGLISKNPFSGFRVKVPPPKKQVLNTKEAKLFLEKAKQVDHNFYHLWAMALLTGMRNGELYALRWKDIDEVSNTITVSCSWSNKNGCTSTKSNKNRVIPISNDLQTLLKELKLIGPFKERVTALNDYCELFNDLVLPRSTEWRHGDQAKVTRKFCETIGITPIKFHDLRATFITNLLAQGTSLPTVMAVVGHARMGTTDEYLRLAGINVKGATENLGYTLPRPKREREGNVISLF